MTRRRASALHTAALLTAALLGGGLAVAAPAAAATVCSTDARLCVSAITYAPAAIDNAQPNPVTVTVRATAGYGSLAAQFTSGLVGYGRPYTVTLAPVSSSPGSYRGTVTVIAGSEVGRFGPLEIRGTRNGTTSFVDGDALAAGGLERLTVTGVRDVVPAAVDGFTAGTGSYDASRGGSIPVSLRLSDALSGAGQVQVHANAVADDPQAGIDAEAQHGTWVALTRTSGTDRSGVWSGSLPLFGGTNQQWRYSVSVVDLAGNSTYLEQADLAARGLPATFRTVTTGVVPAKPTGLALRTEFDPLTFRWNAVATWAKPASGAVAASSWQLNATGACAAPPRIVVGAPRWVVPKTGSGVCRVTIQARNAVGTSAASAAATAILP